MYASISAESMATLQARTVAINRFVVTYELASLLQSGYNGAMVLVVLDTHGTRPYYDRAEGCQLHTIMTYYVHDLCKLLFLMYVFIHGYIIIVINLHRSTARKRSTINYSYHSTYFEVSHHPLAKASMQYYGTETVLFIFSFQVSQRNKIAWQALCSCILQSASAPSPSRVTRLHSPPSRLKGMRRLRRSSVSL